MDLSAINSNFKNFLEEVGSYYSVVDDQEVQILRKKQDECYKNFLDVHLEYTKCVQQIDDKYSDLNKTFKFKTEKAAKSYKSCLQHKKVEECHERTWKHLHENMKQYISLLRRIDTQTIKY
ncbi:unnamed protein product [Paramecium octaurelia]|uniref:T20D4.11-like domain-containing protein n=1 Tax=Paramecium octaurelia TaxID=43137 RepID=A0A8S1WTX0_PAROT|nr:unnamed protein product [Paramecium octaurelia]